MKVAEERIRIVSNSEAPFADRMEAGRLLADELAYLKGRHVVVLGIPRGGMVVAAALARRIKAVLDVVLVRKLRAPLNPELAIGAVTETGRMFLDNHLIDPRNLHTPYVEEERRVQFGEIQHRAALFRAVRAKTDLTDRTVVITDDGLATGATMQAAIWSARQEQPKEIILAVPVAPADTLARIAPLADKAVCLRVPPDFFGVGQFYEAFPQTDDSEVVDILSRR